LFRDRHERWGAAAGAHFEQLEASVEANGRQAA
jgi:hypothetical protein